MDLQIRFKQAQLRKDLLQGKIQKVQVEEKPKIPKESKVVKKDPNVDREKITQIRLDAGFPQRVDLARKLTGTELGAYSRDFYAMQQIIGLAERTGTITYPGRNPLNKVYVEFLIEQGYDPLGVRNAK